jgi:hypothetical protein
MVILMSMDWSLQSMVRDKQFSKTAQKYHQGLICQNLLTQKQYYGQLKKEWAQLAKIPGKAKKDPPGDIVDSKNDSQDSQEENEIKLYRFSAYPLNARLPLGLRHFQADKNRSVYWHEAWWRLLDTLYQSEDFYSSWRRSVDPESFLKELLKGIEDLSLSWEGTGSWGLLQINFENPEDQRVWSLMLKGSDRIGSHFPSLLTCVWAVDLGSSTKNYSKLNLPTASYEIMAALLGERFAIEWTKLVEEKILARMEEASYRGSVKDKWLLDQLTYKEILDQIKTESIIPSDQIMSVVDLSVDHWPLMHEYLIKGEGLNSGYLASTLELKHKPKT